MIGFDSGHRAFQRQVAAADQRTLPASARIGQAAAPPTTPHDRETPGILAHGKVGEAAVELPGKTLHRRRAFNHAGRRPTDLATSCANTVST